MAELHVRLYGHGNKKINQQPTSMMMVELPLGLSMIMGLEVRPRSLAHLAVPGEAERIKGRASPSNVNPS